LTITGYVYDSSQILLKSKDFNYPVAGLYGSGTMGDDKFEGRMEIGEITNAYYVGIETKL